MTRARNLANLANPSTLSVNNTTLDVGINSTSPSADLSIGGAIEMDGLSGVITATSFSGSGANLTGISSVGADGYLTTLTVGSGATFGSNVQIDGVLTYEDVTNVDSVGVVTARTGIKVLAGGINAVGVITGTSFKGDGTALTGVGGEFDITSCLFV
jgi:hypothetical protein